MLQECHEKKLVVPALESLTAGPKYPKSHMVFYEICLKSVVGGAVWRKSLKSSYEGPGGFGTPTDYAFAILILENNYEAWMRKGKDTMLDFTTEYEDDGLGERVLYTVHNTACEYDPDGKDYESYLVNPAQKLTYSNTVKKRKAAYQTLHKKIKGRIELPSLGDLMKLKQGEDITQKRAREKEKETEVRKSKRYTKGGSGRSRYGGWSDEGHTRLEDVTTTLKSLRQKGTFTLFENAVHDWQQTALGLDDSDEEEEKEEKRTVNRSAAWDL
jgi:hypothetical protein